MNPITLSIWLAAAACLSGIVWTNRYCLQRGWWQSVGVGIISGICLAIAFSQHARVSPLIDSLPGNVRMWLWCILLIGVNVLLWSMALIKGKK